METQIFAGTMEELSESELAGAAPDIARRTSDEEISKFLPEKEATVQRRRDDAQRIEDEYGGKIIKKFIRDPKAEEIRNQMNNLNFTNQPKGEEDATIR